MSKQNSHDYFYLCSKESIGRYNRDLFFALKNEVDQESDDYINNIEDDKYVDYLTGKYSIAKPILNFDNVEATTGTKMVPAERFSSRFDVVKGRKYEKPITIIHIPCRGNIELLRYNTGIGYQNTPEVFIEDGNLCFEIIDFYNDPEIIRNAYHSLISDIKTVSSELVKEIERYNYSLKANIQNIITERKTKIEKIVQILGIPIKKRQNLSSSYEIPTAQSKLNISLKPQLTDNKENVEYFLEEDIYLNILQVIHDYGVVFEQYPATYGNKEEEELRDHFLLNLQPRYNWAASGEAFNKLGKTDILIRYEKEIVFIAECKFWHGQKGYLATISQLFDRYLTWRNSKAAVIIFVKSKDFSSVINEVKNVTPNHANFVKFVNEEQETWLNYIFHINDNPSREVKLAVLLFHIPPIEKKISKNKKNDKIVGGDKL
jgi:hypothetical protein